MSGRRPPVKIVWRKLPFDTKGIIVMTDQSATILVSPYYRDQFDTVYHEILHWLFPDMPEELVEAYTKGVRNGQ